VKVGDLVKWKDPQAITRYDKNSIGFIIGFDEDDDPIVFWSSRGCCPPEGWGEFRSQIRIISQV